MSTVVAKNLAVQNSTGTASTNISFDGTKLVSTALDNSITATANLHDLGVGQTWQNVTASRAAGVTYTNSTGKPIMVYAALTSADAALKRFALLSGALVISSSTEADSASNPSFRHMQVLGVIPHGATYTVFRVGGGNFTLVEWVELR